MFIFFPCCFWFHPLLCLQFTILFLNWYMPIFVFQWWAIWFYFCFHFLSILFDFVSLSACWMICLCLLDVYIGLDKFCLLNEFRIWVKFPNCLLNKYIGWTSGIDWTFYYPGRIMRILCVIYYDLTHNIYIKKESSCRKFEKLDVWSLNVDLPRDSHFNSENFDI